MGVLILGRQTFPYKSVNVISKYQIIDSVSINTLLRFLLSPSLVHLSFTFSEFIVFCTLTCSTSLILASRVLVCCLHEVLTILCIVDSSILIRLCNLSQINLYLWQLSCCTLRCFQKWNADSKNGSYSDLASDAIITIISSLLVLLLFTIVCKITYKYNEH